MNNQILQEANTKEQRIFEWIRRVPITLWLFLIVLLTYCYTASLSGNFLVMNLDVIEFFGASARALSQGQFWVIFTSIFVHQDILHLALNSFSLVVIGLVLEKAGGRTNFLFVFFLAALFTMGLSVLIFPMWVFVGTSAGIFGLAGATIMRQLRSVIFSALFILVLFAFTPPLSFLAHGIGAVVGVVADQVMIRSNSPNNRVAIFH
ncbi:MAG: rhomboid family intramembrane serine protease [Candidatus Hodarchaeota archaeon]